MCQPLCFGGTTTQTFMIGQLITGRENIVLHYSIVKKRKDTNSKKAIRMFDQLLLRPE